MSEVTISTAIRHMLLFCTISMVGMVEYLVGTLEIQNYYWIIANLIIRHSHRWLYNLQNFLYILPLKCYQEITESKPFVLAPFLDEMAIKQSQDSKGCYRTMNIDMKWSVAMWCSLLDLSTVSRFFFDYCLHCQISNLRFEPGGEHQSNRVQIGQGSELLHTAN